jgi:predicted O-methyltransferase YrrM
MKKIIIILLIVFVIYYFSKKRTFDNVSSNNVLAQLLNNNKSDKNTRHSYLDLYESLLENKKVSAKNVLEIGIDRGGSIKMWDDYFDNANVYAVDIMDYQKVWKEIKNKNTIILHTSTDAYSQDFINEHFYGIKFDFILDDGPHTLESMIDCLRLYLSLLTNDGILIIEDVQEIEWFDILSKEVPYELQKYIQTFDLRSNKNRYDDLVFVINKTLL